MAIQHELELTFPAHTVTRPVLCEMGRVGDVVFNIVSANVSQHLGRFHFLLIGSEADVQKAEAFLRDAGVGVNRLKSEPFAGPLPPRPERAATRPGEPRVAKKLWITFMDEMRSQPITWEMSCRFDVTFDIRQSSTGPTVSIMAVLLEGPASHVEGAIEFLRKRGAEVEPIEKSVVEG